MSGHEKFYIPHDDLLALIAAIESLETTMDTLNTSIQTLDKHIQIMTAKEELTVTNDADTAIVNESAFILQQKLSTTHDAFLRSVMVLVVNTAGSPLMSYDSDIVFNIDATGGKAYLTKMIFEGDIKPCRADGTTTHDYRTTITLNDQRLPADTTLRIGYTTRNIRVATNITVFLKYVLATFT